MAGSVNAAARIHSGAPIATGKATKTPAGLSEPAGLCSALQAWSGACSPFILARRTGTGKRRTKPRLGGSSRGPHPQAPTPTAALRDRRRTLRVPPSVCCLSFRSNSKGWFLGRKINGRGFAPRFSALNCR